MTQDQRPAKAEHGHLKDSLKKQGRSDQLAEQIAVQTVAQAAEQKPVGQTSTPPKDPAGKAPPEHDRPGEAAGVPGPEDAAAGAQRRPK